jgi:hypothetical protein
LQQKELLEQQNEELTFKPQINKPKTRAARNAAGNASAPNGASTPGQRAGMKKYMERVQKANKLKQEKKEMEDKVFGTGKNWTPSITQPTAPKLTVKKPQPE